MVLLRNGSGAKPLWDPECGGGTHPLEVAVVIDAHHFAAAEADKGDGGGKVAAIGP